VVLIVVCWAGAAGDFVHAEAIVDSMERLGMPKNFEVLCGYTKVVAGVGLLAGCFDHGARGFLTVATATCLVAYFVLATSFHLRVRDTASHTWPAAGLAALSLALVFVAS
jgi:hypothetical protein